MSQNFPTIFQKKEGRELGGPHFSQQKTKCIYLNPRYSEYLPCGCYKRTLSHSTWTCPCLARPTQTWVHRTVKAPALYRNGLVPLWGELGHIISSLGLPTSYVTVESNCKMAIIEHIQPGSWAAGAHRTISSSPYSYRSRGDLETRSFQMWLPLTSNESVHHVLGKQPITAFVRDFEILLKASHLPTEVFNPM